MPAAEGGRGGAAFTRAAHEATPAPPALVTKNNPDQAPRYGP